MKFLAALLFLWSSYAFAEQFLGIEPKKSDAKDAEEEQVEIEDESKPAPKIRSDRPSSSAASERKVGASLGIAAGAGFFSANGSVAYHFNRFVGLNTSYGYERLDENERYGEEHGPELQLVLRLANPTVVTPVAGAGPGYLYWDRRYQNETFDENQSPTMCYFGGINIALSKNFGVAIHRRKTEFLRNRPIQFSDRSTKEDRARVDNNIGFYAAF